MMAISENLEKSLQALKKNNRTQRKLASVTKNTILAKLANELERKASDILMANQIDLDKLSSDCSTAFRDRLTLNSQRIASITESLIQVAALPDPVGEVVEQKTVSNGLHLKRIRSPLGIIFMIFESRPNVILETFSLAFKSGNSIILRGGSDSEHTSNKIYQLMEDTLSAEGLKSPVFLGIKDYDRKIVEALLKRKDLIDVVVPRGGEKLIEFVQATSLMPLIKNDRGVCHAYIDEDADLTMAISIVNNGKTQRPGVCNSLETILVHKKIANDFILKLYETTNSVNLKWYCDQTTIKILETKPRIQKATEHNWSTEYLDQIINCMVVDDMEQALNHIEKYSSNHSEVIVTSCEQRARIFQNEVDSAAVYWNASSRFTDGFEMGLGGELGISTQKLHVRGPVGLRELTTPRWIIDGNGQIRQ